jgi:Carboxypeptidase regulatory-like domain
MGERLLKVRHRSDLFLLCMALLVGILSFGQVASQTNPPQTFHARGTIKDPNDAVVPGAQVTFQSSAFEKTVLSDKVGAYDADLPIGVYRVSAQRYGLGTHERQSVNGASGETLTVDITVHLRRTNCDVDVLNSSGNPATREQWSDASKDLCGGVDSFPDSSPDILPLRFLYGRRERIDGAYVYGGNKPDNGGSLTSVFVEYNLLSIEADEVTYDTRQRTFKAAGNVVIKDVSGMRNADSASFRIANGRAIQTH